MKKPIELPPNKAKKLAETLKKIIMKRKILQCPEELDSLAGGDVIILQNKGLIEGFFVYGGISNEKISLFTNKLSKSEILQDKEAIIEYAIDKKRAYVTSDGFLYFHPAEAERSIYSISDGDEYSKRKKMLVEAGLM